MIYKYCNVKLIKIAMSISLLH